MKWDDPKYPPKHLDYLAKHFEKKPAMTAECIPPWEARMGSPWMNHVDPCDDPTCAPGSPTLLKPPGEPPPCVAGK